MSGKKFVCICLILCLLLPVLPAQVFAEEGAPAEPSAAVTAESIPGTDGAMETAAPETTQPDRPTEPPKTQTEPVQTTPVVTTPDTTPVPTTPPQTTPPQTTPPQTTPGPDGGQEPAAGNPPVLTGYRVSASEIKKDGKVTITVSVKHPDATLRQIGGKENLDITRLVDSFSGGTVSVDVTSKETEMLTYDVTFTDLVYTGVGKSLRFLAGYKQTREPFNTLEVTVVEAVEYVPPEPTISYGGGGVQMDSSVPNLVVSGYNYGGNPVPAGGKFSLAFTLLNTGKLAVENIVVTVDGGDNFTIDGSSNTFFYNKIASNKQEEQTVNMQAVTGAKTGAQTIGITCKYEYVDGSRRGTANGEIRLSIPVIQPDRFQVNQPTLPEAVYAGEETMISLSYVNKGKADVSNVEAELDGEVDSAAKVQYLGNFEPGKSGSIGFVFTPQTAGKTDITLKIQYEDAGQEIHTLTFPLSLDVQDSPVMEGDDMDYLAEEPKSGPGVWPFAAAGAVLLTGAIVFLLLRRRKARKAQLNPEETWEEWDLPQNQEYLGTEHQDEEETTP